MYKMSENSKKHVLNPGGYIGYRNEHFLVFKTLKCKISPVRGFEAYLKSMLLS